MLPSPIYERFALISAQGGALLLSRTFPFATACSRPRTG